MRRGQLVTIVQQGDYGKPRPALIVQSDLARALPSIVVCPLSTTLRTDLVAFRIRMMPSPTNGLREPSEILIDKVSAIPANKVGKVIGIADEETMQAATQALALLFAINPA